MNEGVMHEVPSYTVCVYVAGDIDVAKQLLRRECYPPNDGLCVTVEAVDFIYSGGQEAGLVVGLRNYPRFPTTPDDLWGRAVAIARRLVAELCQRSAMVSDRDRTVWLNEMPDTARGAEAHK